jgi:hypothetical protein
MDGSCPLGLNALGGTLMGAGGILTSCCPSGVNILSDNNPSCDGFVVKDNDLSTIDNSSGGSAPSPASSSVGNGECIVEVQNQFPTCDTCVYSCDDGEEKKCAFGLAGNCMPNCFGAGKMTTCTVPGASGSGGNMDMPFDNMNSSTRKDHVGIVLGMVWAIIGYAILQY